MSDEDDIRRVIALASQLVDDKRFDDWGGLFAEDASFEARGHRFVGRREIVETIGSMLSSAVTKHLVGPTVVELAGDAARCWTDVVTFVQGEPQVSVTTIGRYFDELRRGADGWSLTARVLVPAGEALPSHVAPTPPR